MIATAADHAVKTISEFGSLNFFGVFFADGSEVVGIDQAALQKIDVTVVFKTGGVINLRRNTGATEHRCWKMALIA